jgi:plasmid stabilization system protein ParE
VVVTLGAKAAALRARLAGGGGPTIFRPDLANQTAAEALAAAAAVSRALESQLGRLTRLPDDGPPPMAEGCAGEWAHYCGAVHRAARYALDRGKRVVVVTQPYVADRHVDQQRALRGMLRQQFGHDPRLQHVDLGRTVDLRDTTLSYDGMHLTGSGNRRVAEALVPPLREALE